MQVWYKNNIDIFVDVHVDMENICLMAKALHCVGMLWNVEVKLHTFETPFEGLKWPAVVCV
jgi:hypothetical protein